MKNYYIDKYVMLYDKGQLIQTQRANRWQVPNEETGRAFVAGQQPKAIINKQGFSMYESFIMVIKNEEGHYKRIINESTPGGIIKNV